MWQEYPMSPRALSAGSLPLVSAAPRRWIQFAKVKAFRQGLWVLTGASGVGSLDLEIGMSRALDVSDRRTDGRQYWAP